MYNKREKMDYQPFYAVSPLVPAYPEPVNLPSAQKHWILIQNNRVIYQNGSGLGTVLIPDPVAADLACITRVYLGTRDTHCYYAAELTEGTSLPLNWIPSPVRELSGLVPDSDIALASYAVRILDFDQSTAFCGRCGGKTRPLTTERARICTTCKFIIYPRISPAIIVLVKKGEEVLLARSPRSPPGFFSLIAGFNEPGENLEQTVHREVAEEVGISVKNLRYFGSEPWPFPDSLMAGFVADYDGGEIQTDNLEIEAANWFTRETLPSYPGKASISRSLIKAWIHREI